MRRLTASKLYIATHCAHFLRDDVEWVKSTNTYAKTGSGTHTAGEDMANGNLPDLEAVAAEYGMSEREGDRTVQLVKRYADWFVTQDTARWQPESKLAWDPFEDKPIRIRSKKPRDYSQLDKDQPFAVCGTADLAYSVSIDNDVVSCTDDIKTGFGRHADPLVQGGMLTMMKASLDGADRGRFRIIRVEENDEVKPIPFDFTRSDLNMVKAQIRDVVRAALNDPEPNEGPWCRYCPARTTCKAATGAAERTVDLVPAASLVRGQYKLAPKPEDNAHAAWLMSTVALARAVLDRVEEGVKDYADSNGGVRLADGTVFKAWPTETRNLELTDGAKDLLIASGLAGSIAHKVTIGSIEKAAGGKKAAAKVFAQLKEIGALTVKGGQKYEARKVSA